eukprot:GSMAST32.ASY1.ANO1.2556.1 assembled CDS
MLDNIIGSSYPSLEPYPIEDYTSFVMQSFAEYGNRVAIIDGNGNERTYSNLIEHVDGIASTLQQDNGMQKNEKLLCYSPNDVSYFAVAHGVSKAGGVTSTANPAYGEEELVYQLTHSDARFIVSSVVGLDAAVAAAKRVGISRENIFIMDPENATEPGTIAGFVTVKELEMSGGEPNPIIRDVLNDDFYLPYSSGTTGNPKGVPNLLQTNCLEGNLFEENEVVISPLPSFHCYGFLVNLMHVR